MSSIQLGSLLTYDIVFMDDHHTLLTTLIKCDCLLCSVMEIIIYVKKLLNSDWLRAVQFKCNTSAKSVTPVQITHHNFGL